MFKHQKDFIGYIYHQRLKYVREKIKGRRIDFKYPTPRDDDIGYLIRRTITLITDPRIKTLYARRAFQLIEVFK